MDSTVITFVLLALCVALVAPSRLASLYHDYEYAEEEYEPRSLLLERLQLLSGVQGQGIQCDDNSDYDLFSSYCEPDECYTPGRQSRDLDINALLDGRTAPVNAMPAKITGCGDEQPGTSGLGSLPGECRGRVRQCLFNAITCI